MISFSIVGEPKPQGSKLAFKDRGGNARMKESGGLAFAAWRNAIAERSQALAAEHGTLTAPLSADVVFRFRMPQSRAKALKTAGTGPKTGAPDIDKLLRSLFDGLQAGGLIRNDSLVVEVRARKVEVLDGWIGADVSLTAL